MHRLGRSVPILVALCVGATLSLVIASHGAASNPGGGGAGAVQLPGAATGPTLIPGAHVSSVTEADVIAPEGLSMTGACNSTNMFYSSVGGYIQAPLDLPAGATLWQVDVYGCTTVAGTETWTLFDRDSTTGGLDGSDWPTSTGSGLVHATMSFPSGLTLATGHRWLIGASGLDSTKGFVGAVYQYTLPQLSYVPIPPARVFDSRFSRFGGPIGAGISRLVNVKDAIDSKSGAVLQTNAVPAGARAVTFALTITGTVGAGSLAVLPGTSKTVNTSNINWYAAGQTLATGGTIQLGSASAERQVTIVCGASVGGSTNFILDITGYYE